MANDPLDDDEGFQLEVAKLRESYLENKEYEYLESTYKISHIRRATFSMGFCVAVGIISLIYSALFFLDDRTRNLSYPTTLFVIGLLGFVFAIMCKLSIKTAGRER